MTVVPVGTGFLFFFNKKKYKKVKNKKNVCRVCNCVVCLCVCGEWDHGKREETRRNTKIEGVGAHESDRIREFAILKRKKGKRKPKSV